MGRNFIGYIRDHRTRIGRIRAVTHGREGEDKIKEGGQESGDSGIG